MAVNKETLNSWIRGCQDNKRKYQEKVYKHFFRKMYRMIESRLKSRDDVMIVLNDGFLKAFKYCDKFDFTGSFEGWLRRVMYSCLVDYVNSKNKHRHKQLADHLMGKTGNPGLEALYYEAIIKKFSKLPEKTRKVFEQYVIEGYKQAEIAELNNISIGTVKWHVSNARKILKSELKNMNKREHYG